MNGCDFSHHNGDIDFSKYDKDFAILRIGYSHRNGKGGLNIDKKFEQNYNACVTHQIPIGVYVYCYDETPEAARVTASAVVNELRRVAAKYEYKCEFPIFYDIEYGWNNAYRYDSVKNREHNTDMVISACEVFEKSGFYAGVYASRNFFENFLNMERLNRFDKWVAAYNAKDTTAWSHGMWQKTSTGRVPGVPGNVDINIAYKDYPALIRNARLNGFGNRPELYNFNAGPMTEGDMWKFVNLAVSLKVNHGTQRKE